MLNGLDQAKANTYRPDRHVLGINLGGSYRGHEVTLQELDGANHLDNLRGVAGAASTENGFVGWDRSTTFRVKHMHLSILNSA